MSERVKINERELREQLNSDETCDKTLEEFFFLDNSIPFNPTYKTKPNVELVPEATDAFSVGAPLLRVANGLVHRKRLRRYRRIVREFPDRVRVVSEGDSWFQHPMVEDTIDHLFNHVAIYCLSAAGDEFRDMFLENGYLPALDAQDSDILLLSGGGNDLLGHLGDYLNDYTPGTDPRRLINDEFFKKVRDMMNIYAALFTSVEKKRRGARVLVHGYDYVIPGVGKKGKWLGRPMSTKGIDGPKERRDVIRFVIDEFCGALIKLTCNHPNAEFVDVRTSVSDLQWYDEIHPDSNGFQQVALKFLSNIS